MCVNAFVRGRGASLHLFSTLRKRKPLSPPGQPSKAEMPSWRSDMAIFHLPPNTLPHFPRCRRPLPLPLPAGLSALTSRPNPQNSLPSASMPPLPSSLSAPFSPPSIHLGPAADRWPLRRGSQQGSGLLSGTFFRRWREMN